MESVRQSDATSIGTRHPCLPHGASLPDTSAVLVVGVGNPGRGDDGLGAALCGTLEQSVAPHVGLEERLQLDVADAALIAACRVVYFVDASTRDVGSFRLNRVRGVGADASFSTHSVTPETVIEVCRRLYGRAPQAWLLEIRGYSWGFGAPLSPGARRNLQLATEFLRPVLAAGAAEGGREDS